LRGTDPGAPLDNGRCGPDHGQMDRGLPIMHGPGIPEKYERDEAVMREEAQTPSSRLSNLAS
jgi:hypothetical protein